MDGLRRAFETRRTAGMLAAYGLADLPDTPPLPGPVALPAVANARWTTDAAAAVDTPVPASPLTP